MQPTTVTTIVLILFALFVFALTAYAYLGDWDAVARRSVVEDDDIDAAVLRMRRSIEEYERHHQRRH